MPTPIGTLGTIPTLTVGGRVFTDLTTLLVLHASWSTRSCTFRKNMATSGYQVTAATTLTISAVHVISAGTQPQGYIAQTDNDIGYDVAGTGTNPVVYGFQSAQKFQFPSASAQGSERFFNPKIEIAASKYMSMIDGTGGAGALAYGYEA